MKNIEDSFDIIFLDIPANMNLIPSDTNSQVEESLIMLDNLVSFLNEFEIEKDKVEKDLWNVKEVAKSMSLGLEEIM